jgi:MFS transporter, DHA1 family, tetracycline resistance protein
MSEPVVSKNRKSLLAYLMVVFIDNFGFSIVFVMFAPLFLDPTFGMVSPTMGKMAKDVVLGIAFIAFPLFQLFGAPILGDIADLMGRKKALVVSIIGLFIGFVLSAFSVWAISKTLLIISRCISGFFAGNLSISLAGIADLSVSERERGKNFGYVAALMGGSWIFSMILSGFLSNIQMVGHSGPMLVFVISALLILVNLLIVLLFLQETFIPDGRGVKIDLWVGIKNIKKALEIKALRRNFLVYFLWVIGWGSGVQWLQAYDMQVFHTKSSVFVLFMVVFGALWSCGSSFINTYCLRFFSSVTLSRIGLYAIAVLTFFRLFMPNFFLFALIICISGIISSFTMSNILNIISLKASDDIQGRVMGLSQSIQALGWIVGSITSIVIFAAGIKAFYPILGVLLLIAALILTTTREGVERSQ